jgi:hypothetical protein
MNQVAKFDPKVFEPTEQLIFQRKNGFKMEQPGVG